MEVIPRDDVRFVLDGLPDLAPVSAVARVLGLSRTRAYELVRDGVIRHYRIRGMIRVPRSAVLELLEEGRLGVSRRGVQAAEGVD